jgi:hypothetical protein
MKDLINTIQMELKKKQYLQSCRGLRLDLFLVPIVGACFTANCLLDELTSDDRRPETGDEMIR